MIERVCMFVDAGADELDSRYYHCQRLSVMMFARERLERQIRI